MVCQRLKSIYFCENPEYPRSIRCLTSFIPSLICSQRPKKSITCKKAQNQSLPNVQCHHKSSLNWHLMYRTSLSVGHFLWRLVIFPPYVVPFLSLLEQPSGSRICFLELWTATVMVGAIVSILKFICMLGLRISPVCARKSTR